MTSDLLAGFRGPANRRRDRRLKILSIVFLSEIVIGGAVMWALLLHFHRHHKHVPWWVPVAVIGGQVLLYAVEVAVIVTVHRRRHGTWLPEPAAVLGADKPVRKRVSRAFRKGRLPADRTERALTVDLATKAMRLRRLLYLAIALIVLQVPVLVLDHRTGARVGSAAVIAGLLLIVLAYGLTLRRARRIETLAGDDRKPTGGAS